MSIQAIDTNIEKKSKQNYGREERGREKKTDGTIGDIPL